MLIQHVAVFLFALSVAKSWKSFRFQSGRHYLLKGVTESQELQKNTLYILPYSRKSLTSIVGLIHRWAAEKCKAGSVIYESPNRDGVDFTFKASPGSTLQISAVKEETSFIAITSELKCCSPKQRANSLIQLTATNLISGIRNEIGDAIIQCIDPNNTFCYPNPDETYETDDFPIELPTQSEINNMWEVEDLETNSTIESTSMKEPLFTLDSESLNSPSQDHPLEAGTNFDKLCPDEIDANVAKPTPISDNSAINVNNEAAVANVEIKTTDRSQSADLTNVTLVSFRTAMSNVDTIPFIVTEHQNESKISLSNSSSSNASSTVTVLYQWKDIPNVSTEVVKDFILWWASTKFSANKGSGVSAMAVMPGDDSSDQFRKVCKIQIDVAIDDAQPMFLYVRECEIAGVTCVEVVSSVNNNNISQEKGANDTVSETLLRNAMSNICTKLQTDLAALPLQRLVLSNLISRNSGSESEANSKQRKFVAEDSTCHRLNSASTGNIGIGSSNNDSIVAANTSAATIDSCWNSGALSAAIQEIEWANQQIKIKKSSSNSSSSSSSSKHKTSRSSRSKSEDKIQSKQDDDDSDDGINVSSWRRRNPATEKQARSLGVELDKFEGRGLEEHAMKELNNLLKNSRRAGFVDYIKSLEQQNQHNELKETSSQVTTSKTVPFDAAYPLSGSIQSSSVSALSSFTTDVSSSLPTSSSSSSTSTTGKNRNSRSNNTTTSTTTLSELFEYGKQVSSNVALSLTEIMSRPRIDNDPHCNTGFIPPLPSHEEDYDTTIIMTQDRGLDMQGVSRTLENDGRGAVIVDPKTEAEVIAAALSLHLPDSHISKDIKDVPDPDSYCKDKQHLALLISELSSTFAIERHEFIIDSFRELLLSENFLYMMREANEITTDMHTRQLYKKLIDKSIALNAEVALLARKESIRHLETIQTICEVASTLQHDELKFLERMDELKPYFDTSLLSYLDYAMKEEEKRLKNEVQGIAAAASSSSTAPTSKWLQMLQIVHQGILAEFQSRYASHIEALLLVIRFDQDSELRAEIFQRFVNITHPMELPYFKTLALNMVDSTTARFSNMDDAIVGCNSIDAYENCTSSGVDDNISPLPENTLLQRMKNLKEDVDLYLTDELIASRMQIFEQQIAEQGQAVAIRLRNPVAQEETEKAIETQRDSTTSKKFKEQLARFMS